MLTNRLTLMSVSGCLYAYFLEGKTRLAEVTYDSVLCVIVNRVQQQSTHAALLTRPVTRSARPVIDCVTMQISHTFRIFQVPHRLLSTCLQCCRKALKCTRRGNLMCFFGLFLTRLSSFLEAWPQSKSWPY